jgi:endonuclease/exonuclease/phosphatase family metal-dependent hydrolase
MDEMNERHSFSIASFNTRDFFDDEAPLVMGDLDRVGEYTAEVKAQATRLFEAKINYIASFLCRLDADIVCLQEVKGERVLRALNEKLEGRIRTYPTIVMGQGRDPRGINTGVLSRFPLAEPPRRHNQDEDPEGFSLPVLSAGDAPMPVQHFKRGLLEVVIALPDGHRLNLFNLHLKSGLPMCLQPPTTQKEIAEGQIRSNLLRIAEALRVRSLVDERVRAAPDTLLAVVGDFNDGPHSVVVRTVAGDPVEGFRRQAPGSLRSVAQAIPSDRRFSIQFRTDAGLIDHCLVSDGLWERFETARILNEYLPEATAQIRDAGSMSPESDHAPLLATFRLR